VPADPATSEVGHNFVVLRSAAKTENRMGIYARGGCHLRAMFACAPLIQRELRQNCCILHDGGAARCHSALELQTLQPLPQEWTDPVVEKLRLRSDYFQPRLFDETFSVPGSDGPEIFPKTIVVLHIGMDAGGRTLYRHRQHGFLVDPGGSWLESVDSVLGDLSVIAWFREHFSSIGMVSVDTFVANFTRIIQILRTKLSAPILVFNTLAMEPGNLTYNYQLVNHSLSMRWRAFNLALWDLSRVLGFSVVDMDRILKRAGTRSQTDAAHFLPHHNGLIAQEVWHILRKLEAL
jgi:hypothetical protein